MKIKIYQNFIDNEYCDVLKNWIFKNKNLSFFSDANMNGKRVTTRYSKENIVFPQEAFEIKNKIINHLNLKFFKHAPFIHGMYASIAFKNDDCYLHKDPRHYNNHITLHCNLKLNDTVGGDILVEDQVYKLNKGDLWVYPTSEINHGSNKLISDNRLIWVYGFCLYANR